MRKEKTPRRDAVAADKAQNRRLRPTAQLQMGLAAAAHDRRCEWRWRPQRRRTKPEPAGAATKPDLVITGCQD